MKIIGKTGNGWDNEYIAVVKHSELAKCADRYYGKDELPKLEVGSEFNVGAGHDFRADISNACHNMVTAMEQFERARATLFKFAIMVSGLQEPAAGEEQATA